MTYFKQQREELEKEIEKDIADYNEIMNNMEGNYDNDSREWNKIEIKRVKLQQLNKDEDAVRKAMDRKDLWERLKKIPKDLSKEATINQMTTIIGFWVEERKQELGLNSKEKKMGRWICTCGICDAKWAYPFETDEGIIRASCSPCGHQGCFEVKKEQLEEKGK